MTCPRLASLSIALALLTAAVPAAAVEYQINFRDGTSLRTSRVSQVGGEIHYEKFGGEASVAVGDVATVYVIEKDGTVYWVMEPRTGRAPPPPPRPAPRQPPRPASHVEAVEIPDAAASIRAATGGAAGAKAGGETGRGPEKRGPEKRSISPAAKKKEKEKGRKEAAPAGPPTAAGSHAGATGTPGATAPPRPHPKVVLTPSEPLATRLLRWGAAPVAALLILGGVVLFFRRRFRAAQEGAPVTDPTGGEVEVDFSVPSKAWETLITALEERNFEVYRLCWVLHYSDEDLELAFQKGLVNWKYYDYTITKAEPHPKSKERFYLHIKRSTKFDREDLEERVKRMSLLRTDGGWKFEEVPYGF